MPISPGTPSGRAFRYLADARTAVDSMAYKLRYMDLFAIAAERTA